MHWHSGVIHAIIQIARRDIAQAFYNIFSGHYWLPGWFIAFLQVPNLENPYFMWRFGSLWL